MASPAGPSPRQQLSQMMCGYWISQAVYVTARLDLVEHLQGAPQTAAQLAPLTGSHAGALYRLLRAMASLGFFREDEQGRFHVLELAEPLSRDAVDSQKAWAVMMGEEHYQAWGELLHSVRTGETGFEKLYGMGVFDYLAKNPEAGENFDAAMTAIHGRETAGLLDAYSFDGISVLADIGGGNGSLLTAILQKHPRLKGMLVDLPGVVERTSKLIAAQGLAERCEVQSGDFFQAIPAGADAYLFRHIIHDWDDARSITILKHCHAAMPPTGKLLIYESIIPPGNDPGFAKLLDLTMLVLPGGMERTEAEYHQLLGQAGFRISRIIPTGNEMSLIEAERK